MKPQRVKHLFIEELKVKPAHLGHPYMIFEKHDGWYGYMDIGSGIMSRQMREIPSMRDFSVELNTALAECMPGIKGRLIFEILVEGSPVFKDLNGILNRHEQAKNAYILVHDFLAAEDESCAATRHARAVNIVGDLALPKVRMATLLDSWNDNPEQWRAIAELIWSKGGEGVIAKKRTGYYSPGKRNADILKIKLENSEEMLVVGLAEGEGKYEGTLGALIVQDKFKVEHRVSGMSDHERATWWKHPTRVCGATVEVQFMERLANGSLREGRFKAIRHDKTELG